MSLQLYEMSYWDAIAIADALDDVIVKAIEIVEAIFVADAIVDAIVGAIVVVDAIAFVDVILVSHFEEDHPLHTH